MRFALKRNVTDTILNSHLTHRTVWHNAPSRKSAGSVSVSEMVKRMTEGVKYFLKNILYRPVVWSASNLSYFSLSHGKNSFVPTFDDFALPNDKRKWFLSWIFSTPKLLCEVIVFAITYTVHSDLR